jgi:ribokinase
MSRIIVIGSSNTDMVIKVRKHPLPGETILGGNFFMNPGGKGANQAVAAARLGGNVTFVTKTGNDIFGENALHQFSSEGINASHIVTDMKNPSGIALITVDEFGENAIAVASGSNATLSAYDIDEKVFETDPSDIILMQLEIPVGTVEYVAEKGASRGNRVILNPAPARNLSDDLLKCLYLMIPNEVEAEHLTGIKVTDQASAERAATELHERGVRNIVITLGGSGAYIRSENISKLIPVVPVKATDTTAAGDVFCGAIAVALAEGNGLEEAVIFANRAAAISVTRLGAQASAPYRHELN